MTDVLNIENVLARVRAGQAPKTWRVLRAQRTYFTDRGILYLFLGLLLGAVVVFIAVTGGDYLGAVLAGISVWFFLLARHTFAEGRKASSQVLVLLPEGVVGDGSMNDFQRLAYADIAAMSTHIEEDQTVDLMVTCLDGSHQAIPLDDRFGPAKKLADRIMERFASYKAQSSDTLV